MKEFLSQIAPPIAAHMETLRHQAGEPILLAGEENHHVYFVKKGHAKGYMQTADGAAVSVYLYEEGSLFAFLISSICPLLYKYPFYVRIFFQLIYLLLR